MRMLSQNWHNATVLSLSRSSSTGTLHLRFVTPLCDIKSISGCFTGPRTVTRLSFTA